MFLEQEFMIVNELGQKGKLRKVDLALEGSGNHQEKRINHRDRAQKEQHVD